MGRGFEPLRGHFLKETRWLKKLLRFSFFVYKSLLMKTFRLLVSRENTCAHKNGLTIRFLMEAKMKWAWLKSVRTGKIIGRWWSELEVRVTPAMRSANEISPVGATACVSSLVCHSYRSLSFRLPVAGVSLGCRGFTPACNLDRPSALLPES